MISVCLFSLLLLGTSMAQDQGPTIDDIKDQVRTAAKSFDANETLAGGLSLYKKKCQENAGAGADEAYNKTQEARTTLETCIKTNVNMTELQQQMEEARPEGRLDEVFKKYCERKDILRGCLRDFTDTLVPCLKDSERKNLDVVHNITEQLATFVCHKDGDRIALFIAEKGPECLANKTNEIQSCVQKYTNVNSTITQNVSVDDVAQFNLEFNDETCRTMENLHVCVVEELVKCPQPTPSNIADALFKFVRKATPCNAIKAETSKQTGGKAAGSAAYTGVAVTTLLSALAAVLLL